MADCDDSDDAMCLEKISRSTADLGIAPLESDCDRAGPRKSQMPCSPGLGQSRIRVLGRRRSPRSKALHLR